MNFYLFCCYGAVLFALDVTGAPPEQPLVTLADVSSIKSGSFSGSSGCFAFIKYGYFHYIPKTYHHYKGIKSALTLANKDSNMLARADDLITDSYNKAGNTFDKNGKTFYFLDVITSFSFTDEVELLQFQYDQTKVEIIFDKKSGLRAMKDILTKAKINP